MNKKKTLWTLLAVFFILILLFFSLSAYNKRQAKKETSKKASDSISVTSLSDVTDIRYSNGSQTMHFALEDETWYDADDRSITLAQDSITSIANTFSSITATRKISSPDDLSDYGLSSPAYTITLTDSTGTTCTLNIGNASGEDYYGMLESDSSTVYTLGSSVVSAMQFDITSLTEDTTE